MHLKTQIRPRTRSARAALLDQIKGGRGRARRAARRHSPPRQRRPGGCCSNSRASAQPSWPPSSGWRRYFATLTIAARLASYAGLEPARWPKRLSRSRAGCFQGRGSAIAKTSLIQLAWLWLRHQPQSALTLWFKERVSGNGGHVQEVLDHRRARLRWTAGGVMEICHRRRRHRRSRPSEGRLTIDAQQIIKSPRT